MDRSIATVLMFENTVKKLPIIAEERLVGIVALTDVPRATSMDKEITELLEELSNMHVF